MGLDFFNPARIWNGTNQIFPNASYLKQLETEVLDDIWSEMKGPKWPNQEELQKKKERKEDSYLSYAYGDMGR